MFTCGIFPLGMAGSDTGVASGPPDDFERIGQAITDLQGKHAALVPRTHVIYTGPAAKSDVLAQVEQYAASGRRWDLVLCFRYGGTDVDDWCDLVRTVVRQFGAHQAFLQATAEPNLATMPFAADGAQPAVVPAMIEGVRAASQAKAEARASVQIGINAVPTFENATFWQQVGEVGGEEFARSLDYAGIDLYQDVFGGPIPTERIRGAVAAVLRAFRERDLKAAGIPRSVPIHIAENGWPTGPNRPDARQAAVLAAVMRAAYDLRDVLNLNHYGLFSLRDADRSNDNLFHRFGIMRDDYTPKPAYHMFKDAIAELD